MFDDDKVSPVHEEDVVKLSGGGNSSQLCYCCVTVTRCLLPQVTGIVLMFYFMLLEDFKRYRQDITAIIYE